MGRPLRVDLPDTIHHVTARGNAGAEIYRTRRDATVFLAIVGTTVGSTGWSVLAYCLMRTHYHLLVQTPEANLSDGMHFLNTKYAAGFNAAHGHSGHVFQKRFHSEPVTRDEHLLEALRYVVLNPVRAGIVVAPEDWQWSSYRATAGISRAPVWLDTIRAHSLFAPDGRVARERYRDFIRGGLGCRPARPALGALLAAGSPAEIAAARHHGYSQAQIAAWLGVSQPTVSRMLRARGDGAEY
jgi:REP-associated tyrosine transposase